jgi:hypothetical protein
MPWPAEVAIDFSATGDNIVVPGVTGQTIRVWQLFLVVCADTNLVFKDGSTPFDGPLCMLANGSIVLDDNAGTRQSDRPWFTTSPGNPFVINQTGSGQVSGRIYYTRGLPLSVAP